MHIENITLEHIRTFDISTSIDFIHPGVEFRPRKKPVDPGDMRLPRPILPNVNLILGDNGSGKSSVLKGIAACAFGPVAKDFFRDATIVRHGKTAADLRSRLILHEQDRPREEDRHSGERPHESILTIKRQGERLIVIHIAEKPADTWQPVFESRNDAFFVVGYGATRRVERLDSYDSAARLRSRARRDLRVQSLFEDSFSPIPLGSWLPSYRKANPGRYAQVMRLLKAMLKPSKYTLIEETDDAGDYLFECGGMKVPFQAMSDGYRAFIGWVADLLHHVCYGAPSGKKLVDSRGIVLVDEIDLHLHPRWQMQVIKTVAKALPNMQFIFTSHSPLVAGSVEWMNIITLKVDNRTNRTKVKRLQEIIHGLDADQILLSNFFGLSTTRAASKHRLLNRLRQEATTGDNAAKQAYIRALAAPTDLAESDEAAEEAE